MITSFCVVDILICLCAVCFFGYLYSIRNFIYWKKRGIPYIKPVPFLGNLLDLVLSRKAFCEIINDIYNKFNSPYMGIFILDRPALLVKDRDLIKAILVKDFDHFSGRNIARRKNDISFHVIFLMENPEWKELRKLITPIYSSGKIKVMYKLIAETGAEFQEYMSKRIEIEENVDAREACAIYGAAVIVSTGLGLKGDCFSNVNSQFTRAANKIFDMTDPMRAFSVTCNLLFPNLAHLLNLHLIDTESAAFIKHVFWKTVNDRLKNNTSRNDIVGGLMKIRKEGILIGGSPITDDQMVAQVVSFFVAGFESSSSTISYCLYEFAKNSECQKKAREEISLVFEKHGSEEFTYDIINDDLKYLDMAVKETLRKYPPFPVPDRKCIRDYQIQGTNYIIEKGLPIYIPVYSLHMDPDNFPDPEEFIPERFSEENVHKIKPYSYFPFGVGPRACLGERIGTISVKSAIARIIYNFEVEFCDKTMKKFEISTRTALLAPKSLSLFFEIQENRS